MKEEKEKDVGKKISSPKKTISAAIVRETIEKDADKKVVKPTPARILSSKKAFEKVERNFRTKVTVPVKALEEPQKLRPYTVKVCKPRFAAGESAVIGKEESEFTFSFTHEGFLTIHKIKQGLPFSTVTELKAKLDLPDDSLAGILGSSIATIQRKRTQSKPLNACESDRLSRTARLFEFAVKVLGSEEKARHWLSRPQYGLDNQIPLNLLDTDLGVRQVENLLGRIDAGVLP